MTPKTFKDFDKFQRKDFADRLTNVIATFSKFYDEAFVLSLDAEFGAGKTTFLEMWKDDLENQNFNVIYINAWESDYGEDPILPIVESIVTGLRNLGPGDAVEKLARALKRALGASTLLMHQGVQHFTGFNSEEIIQRFKDGTDEENLVKFGHSIYETYDFKKRTYQSLRDELTEYAITLEKSPLIIFVDELDRVRPNYAVSFLEAMKHIFSVKGVCFVLAVNRNQMRQSIRQLYGDIDFDNYYRRFVTREVGLPVARNCNLSGFLTQLSEVFFDEKRNQLVRFPFQVSQQNDILKFMSHISMSMGFTPREIETLFRIFSQLMALEASDNRGVRIENIYGAILLIAISIRDQETYHRIGQDSLGPSEIASFIDGLTFDFGSGEHFRGYLATIAMAFMRCDKNGEDIDSFATVALRYQEKCLDIEEEDSIRLMRSEIKKISGFGVKPQSVFSDIYDRIENWKSFL